MKSDKYSPIISVFIVVIAILLLINFFRSLSSAGYLNFNSLLTTLGNVPQVSFYNTLADLTIRTDWGVFNFLRDFFNLFTSLLTVIPFIAQNIINGLIYIIYFIRVLLLA